ncbi:hypothetical protein BGZ57DRAFT_283686 [Hyaloscypha finlandica]|nr:hypothetical protein BGZ57DRAFT_283686 [Hyaloscypha finlandica]
MNLPANPSGNAPSNQMVSTLTTTVNFFCNQTNPAVLVQSMAGLDRVGLYLTNLYESPIDFFGMTLLDAPPASRVNPTSIAPSSTTTTTTIKTVTTSSSSLVVPSVSGTSTGIHTSVRTTSGSLILPTWVTFPPTQAMLQCQGMKVPSSLVKSLPLTFPQLRIANLHNRFTTIVFSWIPIQPTRVLFSTASAHVRRICKSHLKYLRPLWSNPLTLE